MLSIGMDIGSTTTKIAAMENGELLFMDISFTGHSMEKAWKDIFGRLLEQMEKKGSDIGRIISTAMEETPSA